MRRQDEIRLLFPSVDAVCQKLLLSELDGYARAFDAEEVHEFLWPLTGHANDAVRRQALVTLTLFLPRYVAARMGAEGQQAGPWSAFRHGSGELATPAVTAAQRATALRLRSAAAGALAPLERAVCERLGALPAAVHDVARMGLAFAGTPAALDALLQDFRSGAGGFESLWAYAHGGGARRAPAELADQLTRYGWRAADALMAAMPLPIEHLRQLAQRLQGRLEPAGVANLAQALGRNGSVDAVRDLGPLLDGAEGWTQTFVLRGIALARQPAALGLVARVHANAPEGFVRQQALRAAGALDCPEAIELCAEAAARAAGPEAAQALESLVALRCPPERLAALARPHLSSGALRARVNALLAAHAQAPATWPAPFTELLETAAPLPRVEAAFCLGYWQSARALEVLALQAASDPHAAVRQQAIKSLSKYPAARAYPVLTHLIGTAPVPEAQACLRVLARLAGEAPANLSELLARQVTMYGAGSVARRAMMVRALGAHAAATGDASGLAPITAALNAPERALLLAALESLKELPEHRAAEVQARLAAHSEDPDPQVWGAALVARFLGGDLDAIGALERRVKSADAEVATRAVLAFTELELLAHEVVGQRHGALARALGVRADAAVEEPAPSTSLAPDAEEGEFRPTSAPPGEAAGGDPVSLVQQRYAALPADPAELGPALRDSGYLAVAGPAQAPPARVGQAEAGPGRAGQAEVGPGAVGKAEAGPGRVEPAEAGPGRAGQAEVGPGRAGMGAAGPLRRGIAVALVCAAVAAGALALRRAPGPSARHAAGIALTVTNVRGRATGQDADVLLAPGDAVRAGADLKLAADARVSLVTEAGDIVIASEQCRAGVDLEPASGALVLALASGALELEVARGRTVLVRCLDATVRAGAGSVRLAVPDGHLRVTLARGQASLAGPGGQPTELTPGVEAHWP